MSVSTASVEHVPKVSIRCAEAPASSGWAGLTCMVTLLPCRSVFEVIRGGGSRELMRLAAFEMRACSAADGAGRTALSPFGSAAAFFSAWGILGPSVSAKADRAAYGYFTSRIAGPQPLT